ncbi:hypothetical protein LINGRAHAP2_LOCUS10607 [Linum grandiflorum]
MDCNPCSKFLLETPLRRIFLQCMKLRRKKIQRVIDGNKGRIAITTDMWTTTNEKRGYMAITAHYVDNHSILRGHLLR